MASNYLVRCVRTQQLSLISVHLSVLMEEGSMNRGEHC